MGKNVERESWVGTKELCEYLGVHRLTIMAWIKANDFPARKVCGHWLYKVSEVDDWIKKQEK